MKRSSPPPSFSPSSTDGNKADWKELNCPVCLENFDAVNRVPIQSLLCQHSLCCLCVHSLVQSHKSRKRREYMNCPICRATSAFSSSQLPHFLVTTLLTKYKESLRLITRRTRKTNKHVKRCQRPDEEVQFFKHQVQRSQAENQNLRQSLQDAEAAKGESQAETQDITNKALECMAAATASQLLLQNTRKQVEDFSGRVQTLEDDNASLRDSLAERDQQLKDTRCEMNLETEDLKYKIQTLETQNENLRETTLERDRELQDIQTKNDTAAEAAKRQLEALEADNDSLRSSLLKLQGESNGSLDEGGPTALCKTLLADKMASSASPSELLSTIQQKKVHAVDSMRCFQKLQTSYHSIHESLLEVERTLLQFRASTDDLDRNTSDVRCEGDPRPLAPSAANNARAQQEELQQG